MSMGVKTNISSMLVQNRLAKTHRDMNNSLEKLSSGQRINKASDDAAGLGISEQFRSRIASLEVAKRNANDGISYIQVAEGGLNEMTNLLVRMRQLATQAASDTIGDRERGYLDREFQELNKEVGRIQASTEFNGQIVLDSKNSPEQMQIYVGSSNRADVNGRAPNIRPENDSDLITVDFKELSQLGDVLGNVTDGNLAVVPRRRNGGASDLGPRGTNHLFNTLDNALSGIASYRATLGSVQTRLSSAIETMDVTSENLSAANSRIRDVDFAEETSKFAQARILASAGASVLAHANNQPEMILQLLR